MISQIAFASSVSPCYMVYTPMQNKDSHADDMRVDAGSTPNIRPGTNEKLHVRKNQEIACRPIARRQLHTYRKHCTPCTRRPPNPLPPL